MARWLLIHPGPSFSVADVFRGWSEALTGLGEQVMEYSMDRRLSFFDSALVETGVYDDAGRPQIRKAVSHDEAATMAADGLLGAAYRWWPSVILCTSAFFTPPWVLEIMRSRGHKIVMLFTEAPYQDVMQFRMAQYAALSLVNDPATLDTYRAIGPAEYMPHSYRPSVHHPGPPVPGMECDLGFVGTGYPSRIKFFEAMDLTGLKVRFGGNWGPLGNASPLLPYVIHSKDECMSNHHAADLYRSARAGINVYRREIDKGGTCDGVAMGPREVEMAAAGLWFLRDPRPEGDGLLPMLPTFTDPAEASEILRWGLSHADECREAAAKARAAVADRTFTNSARKLLALLDQ
jgi:spore maturation protein CgeB